MTLLDRVKNMKLHEIIELKDTDGYVIRILKGWLYVLQDKQANGNERTVVTQMIHEDKEEGEAK